MRAGGHSGVALFRRGTWQVQLFVCDPNSEIVDHIHPNVDSIEVYVGGDVYFRHSWKTILTPEIIATPDFHDLSIRVRPQDWHGASIGPRGGSFLSLQHWLHGVAPISVHLDWVGEPLDAEHRVTLGQGRLKLDRG